MDQIKIGEFISSLRKEKKMSQKDLADKLNVSISAVSKWERGKCLPDVSLFNDLCDILSITINELLKGERKVENKESNKILTDYLQYKEKQSKKRRLYQGIISILIIIVLLLFLYFVNSYKTINISVLSAYSNNFIYENGILIKSKENNALVEGNIKIRNDNLSEDSILYTTFYVKNNDEYYLLFGGNHLGSVNIDNYGYYDTFDKAEGENIYLWIIYLDENNEIKYEELNITSKNIPVNDKLIKLKTIPISLTKPTPSNPMNIVNGFNEYYFRYLFINELNFNHNFYYKESSNLGMSDSEVEKKIDSNTLLSYNYITDIWTLDINTENNHNVYKYNNKDKTINGSHDEIKVSKNKEEYLICSIDSQEISCPKEIEKEVNLLIENYKKYNEFQPIKKEA